MIKIFLENVSAFDFAFLPKNSIPVGKSFFVSITLDGIINKNGMLIDFSEAKKIIKSKLLKFDHKLLVSRVNVKSKNKSHLIIASKNNIEKNQSNQDLETLENFFAIYVKSTWIKIIPQKILDALSKNDFTLFEDFLSKKMFSFMPKNIKNISLKLTENKESIYTENYFNYTHTICNHNGHCQRFHGHSAKLFVFQNNILNVDLTAYAARHMSGLYIASNKYICAIDSPSDHIKQMIDCALNAKDFECIKRNLYAIEYSGSDGDVSILISKHLCAVLNNESTIENITQYVYDNVLLNLEQSSNIPYKKAQSLQEQAIKVCVYEGLTKGAMIE